MSSRKFYKYTIEVVVLSEEPMGYLSLDELGREIEIGNLVGHQESRKEEVLTGKEMAEALEDAASDPEFFMLTPEGEDLDEDLTPEELARLGVSR